MGNAFNTITHETQGQVKDGHYSELGHEQLADKFLEMIGDDGLRRYINSLYSIEKLI